MSVSKYHPLYEDGRLTKDSNPYAQLLRDVLQSNIDANCLAVWASLQSRPDDWVLSPQQLMKQFSWGKNKTYNVLNEMIEIKLLTRNEIRDERGRKVETTYHVHDGQEFLINQGSPPLLKNQELDNQELENSDITKKRTSQSKDYKKTKRATSQKNKRKSSPCLTTYPEDFFPKGAAREALTFHAQRTNNTENELLEKFGEVSKRYKTRSKHWQTKFISFLETEKPKRVYENKTGGTERYDGKARCA